MSRRVASLTLDNLADLPARCRGCAFWELEPNPADPGPPDGDAVLDKEAWLSATLLDWGSCGRIVYVDGVTAGYATYAPPGYVPRSLTFPTSPVSADAVLLMTTGILPEFTGGGLGRVLVQTVAKDLTRRGVRAIEAFGLAGTDDRRGIPLGTPPPRRGARTDASSCVVPADFLLAVGFKTVRPHHRLPRLRLDLRTAISWRTDMELALERLLGSMNPEPAFRPV